MSTKDPKLSVSEELWDLAVRRENIIRPLAAKEVVEPQELASACAELAIKKSLLYRLIKRYAQNPLTSSLLPRKRGRRTGYTPLGTEVTDLIDQAIRRFYLTAQKPRVSKLLQRIAMEASKAGIPCPSRNAVLRRIKMIDARTLLAKREGAKTANDKLRPVIGQLTVERALACVQVDHTKVDVIVVDDDARLPIQRPWLTLLIDVATRMVTGYYLSLEHPSATSIALAIQHSVLPKEEWLEARGITAPWPVFGLPGMLHMDNGRDFHSKPLKRGAQEYGIALHYRPKKTPHFGGHIERLIGTMMGEIHLLPGTTFSNVEDRGEYESERHATMTLKELDQWLAIQIVGKYHNQVHRSLGRPPLAVWNERAGDPCMVFRHPSDKRHFFCDFLPFAERKVRRDGIHLFGIRYWDNVLSLWVGHEHRNFAIRYDPRDLSSIFVQSPDGAYWTVRYADLGRPPITLWEYRHARKRLIEQGRGEVNERILFEAIEAQRALVCEASSKSKAARRQRQRVVDALPPKRSKSEAGRFIEALSPNAPDEEQFQPYECEEW